MIITDIKPQKKGTNRLNVFVDGEFALGLAPGVYEESGIRIGQELTPDDLQHLKSTEQIHRAWDRAQRFLAARPRSEQEIRDRLRRYGYSNEIIDRTVTRLHQTGLIDDAAFATFWKQDRVAFNPRSSGLIARELKQKGVNTEIISQTVASIDNETEAYQAAIKKARTLSDTDYQQFRRKLGGFLQRRGFNYEIIQSTVNRLWQEKYSEGRNG